MQVTGARRRPARALGRRRPRLPRRHHPGFPTCFCLYGPNTNIVVNGSIIYFSECGVRYILGCLGCCSATAQRALDVRKDVHDEFNERVDAENRRMAWGWSDVNSWYKNEHGHVARTGRSPCSSTGSARRSRTRILRADMSPHGRGRGA
jgi:hypothetical protein